MQNDPFSELVSEDVAFIKLESNVIEKELTFDETITPTDAEESSHRLVLDENDEQQFEYVIML